MPEAVINEQRKLIIIDDGKAGFVLTMQQRGTEGTNGFLRGAFLGRSPPVLVLVQEGSGSHKPGSQVAPGSAPTVISPGQHPPDARPLPRGFRCSRRLGDCREKDAAHAVCTGTAWSNGWVRHWTSAEFEFQSNHTFFIRVCPRDCMGSKERKGGRERKER